MIKLQLMSLVTLVFLYSIQSYAAPNLLLQCLAREETLLHQEKKTGVLYRLNQEFINELASSNDITLKKKYIDEVCQSKSHSPSVALLRLLLLKESEIYDLSLSEVESSMRPFKMGYIEEFQKQTPRLFIQYVSGLQAEMPTFDCLSKAIPELAILNERLKYLEEEMTTHEVIRDKKRIETIFSKLQNIKDIQKNCEMTALKRAQKLKSTKVKKKEGPKL